MWYRTQLKENAKNVLRRGYWLPFLICLIVSMISGSMSYSANFTFSLTNNTDIEISTAMATFFVIAIVLSVFVSIFLTAPMMVGSNRFFMQHRGGTSSFSQLLFGFQCGHYGNVVKILFLQGLYTFLWSLLFLVPGIVKSYEYRMIPYILAENPGIDCRRAFELSKQMTSGDKANIFVLNLSFSGWLLLGSFACGIGIFFVLPYVVATDAELYQTMREKAFYHQYSNTMELPGFPVDTGFSQTNPGNY